MPESRADHPDHLKAYRAKRSLERTPEPAGVVARDTGAGRLFVVGFHPGTLIAKRTPYGGTALNVCPVGPAGFSNVADILALHE